jgi:16S rRNA (adenine1518-N6/adenine1519-N6)-dimethyltransferase
VTRLPVVPNRDLGQHFLVDRNILGVIGRMAELADDDIVLEIGPGLGVLTSFLADRVRLVHATEIDRSLEPFLRDQLGARDNVRLVFGDALKLPLDALDPRPGKLVANLPYQIATPVIGESLDGLPTVRIWCVMLQREVAERLFAPPGTKSYGAISVLVQLTADRTAFHAVARTCFQPQPNVDSALVAFRRRRDWDGELRPLKKLVQAGFGHRRKTLANALETAGYATRSKTIEALAVLGRSEGVRAEALAPEEFVTLAEALA